MIFPLLFPVLMGEQSHKIERTMVQNTTGLNGCGCDLGHSGSQGFYCGMNIGNSEGITGTYLCEKCFSNVKKGELK